MNLSHLDFHPMLDLVRHDPQSQCMLKLKNTPRFSAPFKFQLTLSAQPLAGLGWRLKAES
jgi:hypothetical protein